MAHQLARTVGGRLMSGAKSSMNLWPSAGLGFVTSGRSFSAACCPQAPSDAADGQIIESRDFLRRLDSFWDTYGQKVNLTKFSMRHQGMQVMSQHFKVDKVPTTLAVYQGSVLDVHVGSIDDMSIEELLSRYSSLDSPQNSSSLQDIAHLKDQNDSEQQQCQAC